MLHSVGYHPVLPPNRIAFGSIPALTYTREPIDRGYFQAGIHYVLPALGRAYVSKVIEIQRQAARADGATIRRNDVLKAANTLPWTKPFRKAWAYTTFAYQWAASPSHPGTINDVVSIPHLPQLEPSELRHSLQALQRNGFITYTEWHHHRYPEPIPLNAQITDRGWAWLEKQHEIKRPELPSELKPTR